MRILKHKSAPMIILCVGFALFFAIYEYGRVLHLPPLPFHLWRQADCLSLTTNFYEGKGSFMEPVIHAHIADHGESGYSAGELPLLYWAVAQIWHITGHSEFIYRCVGAAFVFLAVLSTFLILRRLGLSWFWAVWTALLVFTSPVIIYYGISFLTDVPAFSLALAAMYCMVRQAQERSVRYWALGLVLFALAVGLKVTSGMGLLALLCVFALVTIVPALRKKWADLFPRPLIGWSFVFLALAPIIAWYDHAERFNEQHGGKYTFNGLWPLWEMNSEEVDRATDFATRILVFQVFDTSVWVLVMGLALMLLFNWRRVPVPLGLFLWTLTLGAALYIILWFHALDGHDYYFINPMVLPLAVIVTGLWWIHVHYPRLLLSNWTRAACVLLLAYNVAYGATNFSLRSDPYKRADPAAMLPIYHDHEIDFWNGFKFPRTGAFKDLPELLRMYGSDPNDLILVPEDQSINVSLYTAGRDGFTGYGTHLDNPYSLERCRSLGARYLILIPPLDGIPQFYKPYMRRFVGRYRDLLLFDLAGSERAEQSDVVLVNDGSLLDGVEEQVSLAPCAADAVGRCFADVLLPYRLTGLPIDGDRAILTEVRFLGSVCWEKHDPNNGLKVLLTDSLGGVTYEWYPLVAGAFDLTIRVDPNKAVNGNEFSIVNASKRGFQLRLDSITVKRFWGPL